MMKVFKYRLYPTRKQRDALQFTLDHNRKLYNAALQERKEAMLPSISLTEGLDGAHMKLHLRVRSKKLLREASAFLRGESSLVCQ